MTNNRIRKQVELEDELRFDAKFESRINLVAAKLQEKEIAPALEAQDVYPDAGFNGMQKVTVDAILTEEISVVSASNEQVILPNEGKLFSKITVGKVYGAGNMEKLAGGIGDLHITKEELGEISTIRINAFDHCSNLKSIDLPDTITFIGQSAFGYCTGLEAFKCPTELVRISSDAFKGCRGLKKFDFNNKIKTLDGNTFSAAFNLDTGVHIILPNSIDYIGQSAFSDSSIAGEIEIPSSVTFVGGVCV